MIEVGFAQIAILGQTRKAVGRRSRTQDRPRRTIRHQSDAEIVEGKSPVLVNSPARVGTEDRQKTTVMFDGRKFIVQSGWPERPVVLLWRKLQDRQTGLVTATLENESSSERCGPIPNPRGRGITKSGNSVDGLCNSGNRLHPSGTRWTTSQDGVRRKTSGNGGGHDG